VDAFIATEMEKQHIPGMALAIVTNGQIAFAKGYGFANIEHQVPVRSETVFQSASMGKQFTSAAIMLLVQDGKLDLKDKIKKYFPEAPDTWNDITLHHLLTHTSGLPNDYPDKDYLRDFTEAELLARAETFPLEFNPGEKWSYSNVAYKILGFLIGKVAGKFYGDFLQERIFQPFGMTTASIISESDIVPNRAAGYRLVDGKLKNQAWVSPTMNTTADGSLYLSVYDMAKWDASLYDDKLLSKASLKQIWTPVTLNDGKTFPYGFGWELGEINKHRLVQHTGAWQGFKSCITRFPDDGLTVIVLANLAQANPKFLAHGVAGISDPDLQEPPGSPLNNKKP
jgi:CubicO group peptidase (beta-lactamase class C family)